MSDRNPNETSLASEFKEFGRQLTETVKAVAGSDQLRAIGNELRDGLREAAQNVEETLDTLREREEVQRLRARASDVATSFKTGEAQREIRQEIGEALQMLNLRLRELVDRVQSADAQQDAPSAPPPQPAPTPETSDEPYTGATRKL